MISKVKESKDSIYDLSLIELVHFVDSVGEKTFRAGQIFKWIYEKGAQSFSVMQNLPQEFRNKLSEKFSFSLVKMTSQQVSEDGTIKLLFELNDGEHIETVIIPSSKRLTLCISTQAGCKYGCKFCASGIGGLKRNLSCGEIISQILYAKNIIRSNKNSRDISHIVFMGVGEPLDNYDNLLKAIRIINSKEGLGIAARKITVSTCGLIDEIKRLSKEGLQIELSISLHGYDNESRNILMPVNRKYPFDELMEACRDYIKETNRQITFEYILIKDVTCSEKAIKSLKKAFKGLICKINLIPYNQVVEFQYAKPSKQEIQDFKKRLNDFGILATLRALRGGDISGACGQLRHK
ncbi:MAG: 23S rRNA (adenine(2503)-C(2))-methyltransferase RlmN [Candidatus Omnitrophica bacterium]|nr:23S rRNA (adenine(2503)-C(2))-methyltransferase RlmN [Candidatus Omnitrophota bacterium]MBU1996732.1 23S rRNA (adenine(2503)-C(2))-methyltransferase RlmN [Candidatus Omnitrophota bacterium]MBU4334357.1 23S rRNA (adenine(2503)-C(2))-methyltransferase RlmN [Candidatus Omnitrophota bacterium]